MIRTIRLGLLFALIAIAVLSTGCKQSTESKPTIEVGVQLLDAPVALLGNSPMWYTYHIKVTANDFRADSVVCTVNGPAGTHIAPFTLYDDGNTLDLSEPAYASIRSEDISAGNGTFTRQINSLAMAVGDAGTYAFVFHVYGTPVIDATVINPDVPLSVSVQNMDACQIVAFPHDSTFAECFEPVPMQIHVVRDPRDHVDSVEVLLLHQGEGFIDRVRADFVPSSGDTLWTYTMTPKFFECVETVGSGTYELLYRAVTTYRLVGQERVNINSFINDPPVLSELVMPDSVTRPLVGADTILATARLTDCELAGETHYAGVRFDVRWNDDVAWNSGSDYYLRDNGEPPDPVAGDGIYNVGLQITPPDGTAHPSGLLHFRFYALECASPFDTSNFLYDSVVVTQETALGLSIPTGGPDFRVVR
jgi:hypothetical protein